MKNPPSEPEQRRGQQPHTVRGAVLDGKKDFLLPLMRFWHTGTSLLFFYLESNLVCIVGQQHQCAYVFGRPEEVW